MITKEAVASLFLGAELSLLERDMQVNLERVLVASSLAPSEVLLALTAAASTVDSTALLLLASDAVSQGNTEVTAELLAEAEDAAALMGTVNTYYRFKHMMVVGLGQETADERYKSAGLRMNLLTKSKMGHANFEMLALLCSVLNGCEKCVVGHEKELVKLGVPAVKILDLARLAAVVRGYSVMEKKAK